MGIASFVIGIITLILSPFLNIYLILPSLLSLLLGIIDTVIKTKKKEPKGLSIAGIVLSSISLVLCILIVIGVYYFSGTIINGIDSVKNEIQQDVISCGINEPVQINNIKITLKSVDKDFTDYLSYAIIDDDCTILKADFEFENIDEHDKTVSHSYFKCYADKFSCDKFNYVEDSYFYETIEPGRKASGSVYFEIPKDADNIEIEYEPYSLFEQKVVFNID